MRRVISLLVVATFFVASFTAINLAVISQAPQANALSALPAQNTTGTAVSWSSGGAQTKITLKGYRGASGPACVFPKTTGADGNCDDTSKTNKPGMDGRNDSAVKTVWAYSGDTITFDIARIKANTHKEKVDMMGCERNPVNIRTECHGTPYLTLANEAKATTSYTETKNFKIDSDLTSTKVYHLETCFSTDGTDASLNCKNSVDWAVFNIVVRPKYKEPTISAFSVQNKTITVGDAYSSCATITKNNNSNYAPTMTDHQSWSPATPPAGFAYSGGCVTANSSRNLKAGTYTFTVNYYYSGNNMGLNITSNTVKSSVTVTVNPGPAASAKLNLANSIVYNLCGHDCHVYERPTLSGQANTVSLSPTFEDANGNKTSAPGGATCTVYDQNNHKDESIACDGYNMKLTPQTKTGVKKVQVNYGNVASTTETFFVQGHPIITPQSSYTIYKSENSEISLNIDAYPGVENIACSNNQGDEASLSHALFGNTNDNELRTGKFSVEANTVESVGQKQLTQCEGSNILLGQTNKVAGNSFELTIDVKTRPRLEIVAERPSMKLGEKQTLKVIGYDESNHIVTPIYRLSSYIDDDVINQNVFEPKKYLGDHTIRAEAQIEGQIVSAEISIKVVPEDAASIYVFSTPIALVGAKYPVTYSFDCADKNVSVISAEITSSVDTDSVSLNHFIPSTPGIRKIIITAYLSNNKVIKGEWSVAAFYTSVTPYAKEKVFVDSYYEYNFTQIPGAGSLKAVECANLPAGLSVVNKKIVGTLAVKQNIVARCKTQNELGWGNWGQITFNVLPNPNTYVTGKIIFADVKNNTKNVKDIAWAVFNKIMLPCATLDAASAKKVVNFCPNKAVTREDLAVALYQVDKAPAYKEEAKSIFVDVKKNNPFYKAISWTVKKKIIKVKVLNKKEKFSPLASVTFKDLMTAISKEAKITSGLKAKSIKKEFSLLKKKGIVSKNIKLSQKVSRVALAHILHKLNAAL